MIIHRMQRLGKLLVWKELPTGRTSGRGSVLSHPHPVSVIIHQRVLLAEHCHRPLLNVILRGQRQRSSQRISDPSGKHLLK